ncbi:MAG: RNA polymerase sigma factor [Deltaproteobacteria bacterium]|nr:RNA polymerase sigma factor [Deltaproteobacteria bacterium]
MDGLLQKRAAAPAALFQRYGRDVQRILGRILGVDSELPDLTQEVFLRALEGIERIDDPCRLRGWLMSTAVYAAREVIRRRRRRWWPVLLSQTHVVEPAVQAADHCAREAVRATYALLDKIDPDDRIALSLHVFEGMELTDTASACGVSLATIKRRIARGRERFLALAAEHPALQDWIRGEEP